MTRDILALHNCTVCDVFGLPEAHGSYVITPLLIPPLDGSIIMERVRKCHCSTGEMIAAMMSGECEEG